jgi:hypothetical protein
LRCLFLRNQIELDLQYKALYERLQESEHKVKKLQAAKMAGANYHYKAWVEWERQNQIQTPSIKVEL